MKPGVLEPQLTGQIQGTELCHLASPWVREFGGERMVPDPALPRPLPCRGIHARPARHQSGIGQAASSPCVPALVHVQIGASLEPGPDPRVWITARLLPASLYIQIWAKSFIPHPLG